jgi:hypothetical protein
MIRLLDRDHMMTLFDGGVDLWEMERVWEMRNDILRRLRDEERNMPGAQVGGPWPPEWIDLFERWTQSPNADDTGHHVVPARAAGPYQLAAIAAGRHQLHVTVTAPRSARTWFDLTALTPELRRYALVTEPPLAPPIDGEHTVDVRETFVLGAAVSLQVVDSDGEHDISLI